MTIDVDISFTDPGKLQKSLNLLITGRDEAFNMLYITFRDRLYKYARGSGLTDHDAEVVADDTLLDFCGKASQFISSENDDKTGEVRRYLFGMASNKVNSLLRKVYSYNAREVADPDDEFIHSYADDQMSVVELMEFDQDKEAVAHCIGRLNIEQRDAILQVYWMELSLDEIAKVQSKPVGTVKSRLFNARKLLKNCIETWINGGRYGR